MILASALHFRICSLNASRSFDLPLRRTPVITLMSGVPITFINFSKYCSRRISFTIATSCLYHNISVYQNQQFFKNGKQKYFCVGKAYNGVLLTACSVYMPSHPRGRHITGLIRTTRSVTYSASCYRTSATNSMLPRLLSV